MNKLNSIILMTLVSIAFTCPAVYAEQEEQAERKLEFHISDEPIQMQPVLLKGQEFRPKYMTKLSFPPGVGMHVKYWRGYYHQDKDLMRLINESVSQKQQDFNKTELSTTVATSRGAGFHSREIWLDIRLYGMSEEDLKIMTQIVVDDIYTVLDEKKRSLSEQLVENETAKAELEGSVAELLEQKERLENHLKQLNDKLVSSSSLSEINFQLQLNQVRIAGLEAKKEEINKFLNPRTHRDRRDLLRLTPDAENPEVLDQLRLMLIKGEIELVGAKTERKALSEILSQLHSNIRQKDYQEKELLKISNSLEEKQVELDALNRTMRDSRNQLTSLAKAGLQDKEIMIRPIEY